MTEKQKKKTLLSQALDKKKYQELSHDIILRNDTSGISYLEHQLIQINELREDSICMSLPKNICQKGHNLSLAILDKAPSKKILKFPPPESKGTVSIIGKVIELFEADDKMVLIEIKFTQYKSNEWKEIMKRYLQQQDTISCLIDEVKK